MFLVLRPSNARVLGLCIAAVPIWGCGLISSDVPSEPNEAEECKSGEVRLSDVPCAQKDFLLEICEHETWIVKEGQCQTPPSCDEGEATEQEPVGDYFFNHAIVECSAGSPRVTGLTCGAVEPTVGENANFGVVDSEGRVDELQGITFAYLMGFGPGGTSTDLSHVLCADTVWTTGDFPPLPSLLGVGSLSINAPNQMIQFGALQKIDLLEVTSSQDEDFRALGTLREVRHLQLRKSQMTSLAGLENIDQMRSLVIVDNSDLASIAGLKSLTSVAGDMILDDSPTEGLVGLERLRSVGGTLRLPIMDEKDFDTLGALVSVGGNLELQLVSDRLSCAASKFEGGVDVGGDVIFTYEEVTGDSCGQ